MRGIALVATLALGSLSLSACAGVPTPADITSVIAQIRATAAAACAFEPDVATVAAIISAGTIPFGQIAGAICSAIPPAPKSGKLQRLSAPATVAGVVIHGRYVH